MKLIIIDINKNDTNLNLNDYFTGRQGDNGYLLNLKLVNGNEPLDLRGKTVFFEGTTGKDHHVEFEAHGSSDGYCLLKLNGYAFQDDGSYKELFLGVKDKDSVLTTVNASMNVLANNIENSSSLVGNYRTDWQMLTDEINSKASQATQALAQFDGFMNSANSEVKSAATYATSATDAAISKAQNAVDGAINDGKQQISNALNQMEIGGTNLLLDSDTQDSDSWYTKAEGTHLYRNSVITRQTTHWNNPRYKFADLVNRGVINTTDNFVYSCYMKVDGSYNLPTTNDLYFASNQSTDVKLYNVEKVNNQNWTQVYAVFKFKSLTPSTTDDGYGDSLRFELNDNVPSGSAVLFACWKLERGTVPTDYSRNTSNLMSHVNNEINTAVSGVDSNINNQLVPLIGKQDAYDVLKSLGKTSLDDLPVGRYACNGWNGNMKGQYPVTDWISLDVGYDCTNGSRKQFIQTLDSGIYYRAQEPNGGKWTEWHHLWDDKSYVNNTNMCDTNLMNGASGTIKTQQLGNAVTVNLIASNINSGDVVYQLPQQYRPSATQQAACVEANNNTEYADFFSINTDGTIAVSQRRFDNASIPNIALNATFQYFLK